MDIYGLSPGIRIRDLIRHHVYLCLRHNCRFGTKSLSEILKYIPRAFFSSLSSNCETQTFKVCLRQHRMADEDLSDEQLKQLLKDAEQRLKEAKGSKELQTQNASVPKRYVHHGA